MAKEITMEKMANAFGNVVWYNGYLGWFRELEQALRKDAGSHHNYLCPIPVDEWNTDWHCLWMFLVGLFGNWGTSIRSGWIEDRAGAAAFLRAALAEYGYEEEDKDDG